MSPKSSSPPQKCGNFELKCSVMANELIPVHKFVSNKTGLTAVVAEVEGPLVNGYFCLATEAHDDDGLPHTLEHLIFLGSEKYPYKGVLDLLANRCLASGTNAWTDTDHTCYTMTTAGSEGFLSLMPIYLEHILYPTLTDAGFITEVYHVNGEGKDGGVVFTEMQGVENTGPRRVSYELNLLMYPGHCGYKSETGGVMKNLRESTNNTKIREFHKKFYRPENMYVIVVGSVEPVQVLQALEPVEDIILSKGDRGEFTRPWQSPIPPVPQSEDILVWYPSDEEEHGMVYIGWRGPSVVNDYYKFSACVILLKYLTDTAVSPLPKEFVDIPEPYASKVSYTPIENNESEFLITFDNVPVDKLDLIKEKLDSVFQSIVNSPQPFDMKRLQTVLNRYRLESLASLENTPHESIAYTIIGYMLHGRTIDDLDHRLNFMRDLDKMAAEPEKFWVDLMKEVFIDSKSITARGCPKIMEQKRLANEEKQRVDKRLMELGKAGLEAKEQAIRDAMSQNDIPPPSEMLVSVPIPSTESIQFHGMSSFNSESSVVDPRFDTSKVPLYVNVDNLKTNFVYVFVLMDTSKVQTEFRPYLAPLLECLLESPIQRGDTIIPYEEVVAQLEEDTIAASGRVGPTSVKPFTCGPFPQTACLLLQLEAKKYQKAVDWITDLLYNTVITDERIKILASKIVNNVAEVKRNGSYMSQEITRGLMYSKNSNHYASSALYQQKALSHMLTRMKSVDESIRVVEEFKALRAELTQPGNMVLHIMANLDTLSNVCPDLAEPWRNVLPQNLTPVRRKLHVVPDWQLLAESANAESCVVGIGAVESAFLCHTSPCTKDFNDPELATLLVFFQYFTQLEGPMWKQIRGQGLAYSYNIVPRPNESKLYFTLYRASNVVGAYKTAKSVIESSLNHDWDPTLFDSAKTSLIFEIVQREKCIGDVVVQSLLAAFKGVTNDYNRQFVRQISKVSINDVAEIAGKYDTHMFNPDICKTSVICHPSKVEEITKGLNETGLRLKSYSSVDEAFPHLWTN